MKSKIIYLKGKISNLSYKHKPHLQKLELPTYEYENLSINSCSAFGYISNGNSNTIAYSKWVTPKRTRSYPFARIYNTYGFSGKVITIIPIIKDEGYDTNNDRINFITLSWMNLMNVYIVLAYYDNASKLNDTRITKQLLNNDDVKQKIEEIINYKFDAHHWNNNHFIFDFKPTFLKAVEAYRKISLEQNVKLHTSKDHLSFLEKIQDENDNSKIDLQKYSNLTLINSGLAAARETKTIHKLEFLESHLSVKPVFEMQNNLGGIYYLTCDELIFLDSNNVIIQESKNSSKGLLPSEEDIKDGLFKLILFSHLERLMLADKELKFVVQLKLTGDVKGKLELPAKKEDLISYSLENNFKTREMSLLELLNEEANSNNIKIIIDKH